MTEIKVNTFFYGSYMDSARDFGFPQRYIQRLESFRPG
jgi:hypothetical protein